MRSVKRLDVDAMHDFDVELQSGDTLRVECKNASPKRNAAGLFRVEVQKTRSSKNDPASRFYSADSFDVVAACVFSATGRWEFLFGRTSDMQPHSTFADRLAPVQVIGTGWATHLADLYSGHRKPRIDPAYTDAVALRERAAAVDDALE